MDLSTLFGVVGAWVFLIVAAIMEGTHVATFMQITAFMIVVVGTFMATMASFPMEVTKDAINIVKKCFVTEDLSAEQMIETMVGFATKARREGLLGLEEETEAIENDFLKKGLQLVVDGTDIELVRNILETDIAFLESRHGVGAGYYGALGGYCPTFGIIGTVMGLVHALGSVDDPSQLAGAISLAFIATFYGIAFANIVFLPMSFKLAANSKKEVLLREVMLEGILSISAGDNPRIVEEKLKAFMPPKTKIATAAAEEGEGGA